MNPKIGTKKEFLIQKLNLSTIFLKTKSKNTTKIKRLVKNTKAAPKLA
jgi:hypothetical protein